MQQRVVYRSIGRDAEELLLGTFASAKQGTQRITQSTELVRKDGSLLAVLIKGGIEREAGRAMFQAIRNRITKTDNHGLASGQPRIQRTLANGLKSRSNRTHKAVASSIMGYYDRYVRFPYCRKTSFIEQHPEAFRRCIPALRCADALFEKHAPVPYARQAEVARKTHADFLIPGTTFTTVTLNKNFRTAYHRDAGDLPEGFGVMSYYRSGKFTGGDLVLPSYGVSIALESFDLLLFDPHEVHGNTEVKPLTRAHERITCVHYYRANMHYCGSAAQELELARAHDARQGSRNMRALPA